MSDLPAHYSLGFASLAGVFPSKSANFNYGNTYNAYGSDPTSAACSYLSSNYCAAPNYNNFNALRYKTHGYPSI